MTAYQKTLTVLVIVLVIFNAILVGFIWFNRPDHRDRSYNRKPDRPEIRGKELQEKLDLSREQAEAFRNSLRTHHRKMRNHQKQLDALKRSANEAILMSDSVALIKTNEKLFEAQRALELEAQSFTRYLSEIANEEQRQELLKIFERTLNRRR